MIRWLSGLAVGVLCVGAAQAQETRVVSGDHNRFTRLVFYLPEPLDWSLARTDAGYEVDLTEGAGRIRTSGIFSRISRDRLADLSIGEIPGRVSLALDCECHAITFEVSPRIFALDIRDGPAPEGQEIPYLPEEPGLVALPAEAFAALGSVQPSPLDAAVPGAWTTALSGVSQAVPLPLIPELPPATDSPLPDLSPQPSMLEQRLIEQVARAASQGLLDPASLGQLDVAATGNLPIPENLQVHSSTSLDEAYGTQAHGGPVTDEGYACLDDEPLNIGAWGADPPDWDEISDRRAALLGEFDRVKPEAAIELARSYLYFGFGAEAQATMAAFAPGAPEREMIGILARILDREPLPETHPLIGQVECDSLSSFWAVMANSMESETGTINRAAVIRGFSDLPLHLRRLLGPTLSDRLLQIDEQGAVHSVEHALTRAPGDHGSALQMMQAGLAESKGNLADAERTLRSIVRENGDDSIQALISLFGIWEQTDRAPPEEFLTQAEALAFELRGSRAGDLLSRSVIVGMAAAGDYDGARDELERTDWTEDGAKTLPAEAENALLSALVTRAGRDAFLSHIFADMAAYRAPSLERPLRRQVAERLAGLGFPDEARSFLDPDPVPEDQLILARIALAQGDSGAALALLQETTGPEADTLRAEALAYAKDHPNAATAFAKAENTDRQIQEAWRSGDWAQVEALGSGAQSRVASMLVARQNKPDTLPSDPSLGGGQALLSTSAETREALNALLSELPIPEVDP